MKNAGKKIGQKIITGALVLALGMTTGCGMLKNMVIQQSAPQGNNSGSLFGSTEGAQAGETVVAAATEATVAEATVAAAESAAAKTTAAQGVSAENSAETATQTQPAILEQPGQATTTITEAAPATTEPPAAVVTDPVATPMPQESRDALAALPDSEEEKDDVKHVVFHSSDGYTSFYWISRDKITKFRFKKGLTVVEVLDVQNLHEKQVDDKTDRYTFDGTSETDVAKDNIILFDVKNYFNEPVTTIGTVEKAEKKEDGRWYVTAVVKEDSDPSEILDELAS